MHNLRVWATPGSILKGFPFPHLPMFSTHQSQFCPMRMHTVGLLLLLHNSLSDIFRKLSCQVLFISFLSKWFQSLEPICIICSPASPQPCPFLLKVLQVFPISLKIIVATTKYNTLSYQSRWLPHPAVLRLWFCLHGLRSHYPLL